MPTKLASLILVQGGLTFFRALLRGLGRRIADKPFWRLSSLPSWSWGGAATTNSCSCIRSVSDLVQVLVDRGSRHTKVAGDGGHGPLNRESTPGLQALDEYPTFIPGHHSRRAADLFLRGFNHARQHLADLIAERNLTEFLSSTEKRGKDISASQETCYVEVDAKTAEDPALRIPEEDCCRLDRPSISAIPHVRDLVGLFVSTPDHLETDFADASPDTAASDAALDPDDRVLWILEVVEHDLAQWAEGLLNGGGDGLDEVKQRCSLVGWHVALGALTPDEGGCAHHLACISEVGTWAREITSRYTFSRFPLVSYILLPILLRSMPEVNTLCKDPHPILDNLSRTW